MIYIYQNASGFRVVEAVNPKRADEHRNVEPRVYRTAADAYRIEADPAIRLALLRFDSAAGDVPPTNVHHIKRRAQAGSASVALLAVLAFLLLIGFSGGFYRLHFHAHGWGAFSILIIVGVVALAAIVRNEGKSS